MNKVDALNSSVTHTENKVNKLLDLVLCTPVPETDKSKRYGPPNSPNSPSKPPRARQVQEVGAAATTAATEGTVASLGGKGVDRESEGPSLTSPVEASPATHSSVPGVPGRDRRWDWRNVSPSPRGEGMAFRHLTPGGLLYGGSGSDLALVSTRPRPYSTVHRRYRRIKSPAGAALVGDGHVE
jgi:hypothetical protein